MSEHPPNRLIHEKSPYLLQHAHNPVDWYPYGEEAFARARAEGKPIFLSIGYSTCHWCHVMERESFEDPDTARLMNERYVCIKVDREERPDVDQIYMQAVMMMTGQGGWPLNVWLGQDLEPFYGGTYFPPEARYGHPAFANVLETLARMYEEQPERIREQARHFMEALRPRPAAAASDLPADLGERAADELARAFDPTWGGFGDAPKFPRPAALSFLVHRAARHEVPRAKEMVGTTLEMMWRGGMYDHVGGGFARYSTDDRWLVPHFEKMLYDNAQLVDVYLDGALRLGRPDLAEVARDVLAYVAREMTHPDGGFYSAQDADSEGEEGKFYVFTMDELREALGESAPFAARVFGARESGNWEGSNILHWPKSVADTAAAEGLGEDALRERRREIRERLYRWRERRVRPGLDDKVLASWNGLMIGACARAGAVLGEPRFVQAAERAAAFVDERLRGEDGGLLRRWRDGDARFEASLDDHAFLGLGLLRLFEATGRVAYLERVAELLDAIERLFRDPDGDAYFFAAARPDLVVRLRESYDGALPSGNAAQALLLARAGALLDREELRGRALAVAGSFRGELQRMPSAHPVMLMAVQEAAEPPRTLFVTGEGEAFARLLRRAHEDLFPGRLVVPVLEAEREGLARLGVPLHGKAAPPGAARGFLCEGAACRPWPS